MHMNVKFVLDLRFVYGVFLVYIIVLGWCNSDPLDEQIVIFYNSFGIGSAINTRPVIHNFFSVNAWKQKQYVSKSSVLKSYLPVSLIIAATAHDVDCLQRLLKYVSLGSALPSQIIIVLSQANAAWFAKGRLLNLIQTHTSSAINTVVILRNGKWNQAENRNRGLSVASEIFVTFFDSDDIPHPQRLEIVVNKLSQNPHIKGVLHGYLDYKDSKNVTFDSVYTSLIADLSECSTKYDEWDLYQTWHQTQKENPHRTYWCCEVMGEHVPSMHNAMLTVRRSGMFTFFSESLPYYRREDSRFISDLITAGNLILTLNCPLAIYDRSGTCRQRVDIVS